MRTTLLTGALTVLLVLTVGCKSDGSSTGLEGIPWAEVAGIYVLTELSFDPQGVLPETDIMERMNPSHRPTLALTAQGLAQVTYQNPDTGLVGIVTGSFGTTATEVRIDFGAEQAFARFLLSRNMAFIYSEIAGTLTYEGSSSGGVSRAQLLAYVPEWQDEQLFDPTPGTLRVQFTR